ncbi:AraC-like DNA-binding protein [Melghiribacillus thermohalophilus]|uniref:AraC-like DNA-binding protein n=2 Tax=Melghiribacillus thermohalophilus TaxID=1324956 RepID=A0A4R3NGC3_9BACI|nr:AraC-like DNA-binding protein [Melghiribacillus thermohalophilus]
MKSKIKPSMKEKFQQNRMKNLESEYFHPSFLMEQRLLDAIQNGNRTKSLNILGSINRDQRPKLADQPLRSLKNSLICSCTLFTRAIIQGGVQPEKAFTLSDTYILEIERMDDYQELEQLEYSMLDHFIQVLKDEEKLPYSKTVNRAITYIHDHILQDLKLGVIAKQSFVSSSYLSHLFRKEVGVSIVQYINQKRIEESKYFLLHTTSSISEISSLFRFCNQSYYTSLFKKYTGITPKEFREKHINNKQ